MTEQWQRVCVTQTVDAHRSGWIGVWDAVKAAITRRPRLTVETPVTLSAWVKGTGEMRIQQAEVAPGDPPRVGGEGRMSNAIIIGLFVFDVLLILAMIYT